MWEYLGESCVGFALVFASTREREREREDRAKESYTRGIRY